jgi:hypothetical protein
VAAAIELPGDWTSARLLVRILYTIGSDWELTEQGLVHRELGDTCTIAMRGTDAGLPERYRAWEDPVFPSFQEEDFGELGSHKAVVELTPGAGLKGRAAALALLRCGSALVDAGARAVGVVGSRLAHSSDRWSLLAGLLEGSEDTALLRAFVRPTVRDGDRWRTLGLGLLGLPDVVVHGDVDEAYAFEMQEALSHRLLTGVVLTGNEVLQAGNQGPRVGVRKAADEGSAANPHGVWRLEPA